MATHISEMPALPINQRPAAVHAPEKGSPRPTRGDRTHPPILHTMNTNRPHPTVNILLPFEIMAHLLARQLDDWKHSIESLQLRITALDMAIEAEDELSAEGPVDGGKGPQPPIVIPSMILPGPWKQVERQGMEGQRRWTAQVHVEERCRPPIVVPPMILYGAPGGVSRKGVEAGGKRNSGTS